VRYIVLSEDGTKNGPADIDTLNKWIAEGELRENSLLQEELSSKQHLAVSIPQLRFSEVHYPNKPPQYVDYPRRTDGYDNLDGSLDLKRGWVSESLSGRFCSVLDFSGNERCHVLSCPNRHLFRPYWHSSG